MNWKTPFVLGLLTLCGGTPSAWATEADMYSLNPSLKWSPVSPTNPLPGNYPLPYTASGTMAVTGSSQSVSVAGVPATLPGNYLEIRPQLEFSGTGSTVNVYVCPMGGACTTSTAGAVVLAPGQPKTFRFLTTSPTLPTVVATGTGTTLYLQW